MQKHSWLVSVLHDLEAYAEENELPSLTQEIVKAKTVAIYEIGDGISFPATTSTGIPARSTQS